MKILIFMNGFFPGTNYGGPPVSVDNFCSLMKEYECYIVCLDHDLKDSKRYENILEGWNSRDNCKVKYLSDSEFGYKAFSLIIEEIKPNLIYLQSLFQSCVLPVLRLAKKHDIKLLLAPRGELCAGAFSIKKYKKVPYVALVRILGLSKNIYFQSTSEEETLAINDKFKVGKERILEVTNIPSIPKVGKKENKKISGSGRFIFLSRISPKKNLLMAIKLLKEVKGEVTYDIYGPIEDKSYWDECLKEIAGLPSNIKVNYCGSVAHDFVFETFSNYDAFLFPTLSENYGHVIVEAMGSGCSVIISDQTPWNDINERKIGWAISLNDEEKFVKAIQKVVDMDAKEKESLMIELKRYYDEKINIENIHQDYLTKFSKM